MKFLRGILGIFCLGGAVLTNQGAAALAQITLLCVAALLGGSRLHAQPALNRVLELDGDGSYVELPANLLANLKEVTVEGWVNWASFHLASRFFDFGGGPFQLNVQNRGGTSTLWFESPEGRTYRAVTLLPFLIETKKLPCLQGAKEVPLNDISGVPVSNLTRKAAQAALEAAVSAAVAR